MKGSHLTLEKAVGSHTVVTVVVMGKKEIPRGTLASAIKLAGMTVEEFVGYLH
jgi:predicted RNA binding protein YcfA (HicA-like mRNA interferase family)